MSADAPSRRQADLALQDLQTGMVDLQGGQSEVIKRVDTLAGKQTAVIERVDRLDYAVFGFPDTEEKGLLGEQRETNAKLNRIFWALVGFEGSLIVALVGIAAQRL